MLLFGSLAGCGYYMANYDTFTKQNTNAYCALATSLSYIGLIAGPATLHGLMMVDYCSVPRRFTTLLPKGSRSFAILPFIATSCSAIALTLVDDLNLWYVVPLMMTIGFSFTAIVHQSQAMGVPVWFTRSFS